MWRLVDLEATVRIAPMFINAKICDKIREELHSKVEGQMTSQGGMILGITDDAITAGTGRVSQRTGYVLFDVKYKALVCAPRRGEIIDSVITHVSEQGVRADAGPLHLFVPKAQIPDGYTFDFGSNTFRDATTGAVLEVGCAIRVRLISVGWNTERMRLISTATLKGPGLRRLGLLNE